MKKPLILILSVFLYYFSESQGYVTPLTYGSNIIVGAERTDQYFPLIKNKRIGLVVNPSSVVKGTHLVDTLFKSGIKISGIFAPEHGFRGNYGAGDKVSNEVDQKTGLKIFSLYGENKKPKKEWLKNMDIIIFDIQDVGVRFYTYISTLHYVMEACAENNIELIVLDRPNPNGFYIDGPILEKGFSSFVGMHPVPIVHGCTIGEYADMINGENWLSNGLKCKLKVVECLKYDHQTEYELPIKPSPNLPNQASIYLYPSLCFFEGTDVSVGRGTDFPFNAVGAPWYKNGNFEFTPVSIPGVAPNPPHLNKLCKGYKLESFGQHMMPALKSIHLDWLIEFYQNSPDKAKFFNSFFDKLAGTDQLRKMIIEGKNPDEIRESWKKGLEDYKKIRAKYLRYPDFY